MAVEISVSSVVGIFCDRPWSVRFRVGLHSGTGYLSAAVECREGVPTYLIVKSGRIRKRIWLRGLEKRKGAIRL